MVKNDMGKSKMKVQIEFLRGLLRYLAFGGFWGEMTTFEIKV